MEKRTSSFEDHLSVIESGHNKTASKTLGRAQNDSLLAKLAEELGVSTPEATTDKAKKEVEGAEMKNAPEYEGQRELAGEDVAATSTAVEAATDGVINPQQVVAGGDPARQIAGMAPHMMAPQGQNPAIATGEHTGKDAQSLGKTQAAVASAARGVGEGQTGTLESAAVSQQVKEAALIGEVIAKSFQQTLEKSAADAEYTEALNFLKEAHLLDDYKIEDEGIQKTASYQEGALEKIANNESLSHEDIVNAAAEYSDLLKMAEDAEAQGRADAHEYAETYATMRKEAQEEATKEISAQTESEKIAALKEDPQVVAAVKVLTDRGLI